MFQFYSKARRSLGVEGKLLGIRTPTTVKRYLDQSNGDSVLLLVRYTVTVLDF